MNASPADVLRAYIVQAGLAVSPTPSPAPDLWPIVTGGMPASDRDNFIAVADVGAKYEGRVMRTGARVVKPRVLVTLRSLRYDAGWDKGAALMTLFDNVGVFPSEGGNGWVGVYVYGVRYTIKAVHVTVPCMKIGEDEKNRRQVFTINTMMTIG